MNSKTAQQLKTELLAKKKTLMGLQALNHQVDSEHDSALKDTVDRSDVEEAWFTKERMSQHWKLELNRIESALHKINAGSFGVCEECDAEIPVKRLRVRPDATLCLFCQESMEKELGPSRMIRPVSSPMDLLH